MRFKHQLNGLIVCLIWVLSVDMSYAQNGDKTEIRSLITATHFKLFEQPISTQKLDGFMRFYTSTGDKSYAYNVLAYNLLSNNDAGALPKKVLLKDVNHTIPEVRKNYSERLYAMYFNMVASTTRKSKDLFVVSMIQFFSSNLESFPNLPINDIDIKTMNNACEFVISIDNSYNSWAMKHPEELKNFIAIHEQFYLDWKSSNPAGTYEGFSQAMEDWTKANTPFEFVLPSQINSCSELTKTHKLIYNELELLANARIYIATIFRDLLNRSPKPEESRYLMQKVDSAELSLNDLLFLILTSTEYKGVFL